MTVTRCDIYILAIIDSISLLLEFKMPTGCDCQWLDVQAWEAFVPTSIN